MGAEYTKTVFSCNTKLAVSRIFPSLHDMPMGYLDRLSELRRLKGLTQTALAEKIGVEQPTVQRWEAGKREPDFAQCSDERNRGWDHMPGWTEWWWSALGAFALTLIAYTIIAAVVWTAKWVWRGRPKKNIP